LSLLVASAVVVVFLVVCLALRIVDVARAVNRTAAAAFAGMRDPALDDDAKERAARTAALALFKAFLAILWRGGVALVASIALLEGADLAGLAPAAAVMRQLESWPFIMGATVVLTALYAVVARRRRPAGR